MSDSKKRPPLDYLGFYNIPGDKSWKETPDIKRLKVSEFYKVRTDVVAALSKHGTVYGECDGETDFFVYDDKFCDRTQKIELSETDRLPQIIVPTVAELQRVLKQHPLWRIMFIGGGRGENQAKEEFFVVYPDTVRIRQLGNSINEALVENAQIRLRHRREPEDESSPSSVETTTPNTVEPEVSRSENDDDLDIAKLKHWSRVALAAEAAEIVRPLFNAAWPEASDKYRQAIVTAIKLAARSAAEERPCSGLPGVASDARQAAGRAQIPHIVPLENFDDGEIPPADADEAAIATMAAKAAEMAARAASGESESHRALEAFGFAISAARNADRDDLENRIWAAASDRLVKDRPWWKFW